MTVKATELPNPIGGPLAFENWKRSLEGGQPAGYYEYQLYSDSNVGGDAVCGPYTSLCVIREIGHDGDCYPSQLLRFAFFAPKPDFDKQIETKTDQYHGGGIQDEVAALLALENGIRLKAGGKTRVKGPGDMFDRPFMEDPGRRPSLVRITKERSMVPWIDHNVSIESSLFAAYHKLSPESAVALARAARLFQHALWTADANPSDAWLLLVSAVEVAAIEWRDNTAGDSVALFSDLQPEWAERLKAASSELLQYFAGEWRKLLKATGRFRAFLLEFMPEALPDGYRPQNSFQINWDRATLKRIFNVIYDYRSQALHAGVPFPLPMCMPPHRDQTGIAEYPIVGLMASGAGGQWTQDAVPICFHVFARIVGHALKEWWKSLQATAAT